MSRPGPGGSGVGGDHTVVNRPLLDSPSDYLLAAVLAVTAVGSMLTWLIGQTAALITGGGWAPVSPGETFAVATRLPEHLGDPAAAWPVAARAHLPGPVGFAVATVLDLLLLATISVVVLRRLGGTQRRRGMASAAQITRVFSPAAVRAAGQRLRPTLQQPPARPRVSRWLRRLPSLIDRGGSRSADEIGLDEVSVDVGRADPGVHGTSQPVRLGIENSVLVLAAARQGKTSQVVIPWVTSWPGPVLVTSVRPDVLRATAALRAGNLAVLDLTGTTWPHALGWSPTTGCQEFDTARRRADLMITVGKQGHSDATNAVFFGTSATNLLAGWMHAAALTGRTMREVLTWALDEHDTTCVDLLRRHSGAAPGVAGMLDALYRSPAETRSNLFATVLTGLAPLLSPVAHTAFCPTGPGFDPAEFLRGAGSVYLIVPETHTAELAPMVSVFVDEIVRTATAFAATAPTGRLDPPLGLFLDEVANVAPLPKLPDLMSYAAGSGIFVAAVLQDLAQARQRWGRDGADMLWGAATCKLVLGGLTGDEPETISRLVGTYRERLTTTSRTPHGPTVSTSLADRQILTPEAVRTLDPAQRQGLLLHATTPPVITRMVRHYESPRAGEHAHSVEQTRPQPVTGHEASRARTGKAGAA
ncbi:MAG: type IV secretory system conjugative DNA transfer family protein [Actinomycetales bacterium]|nr:type IV secretory system conjugative DNA transfer family protein [Actinomycetales bacterium]